MSIRRHSSTMLVLGLVNGFILAGCQGYHSPPMTEGPAVQDGVHYPPRSDSREEQMAMGTTTAAPAAAPTAQPSATPKSSSSTTLTNSKGTSTSTNTAQRSDASLAWSTMTVPTGDLKTSVIKVEKGVPREVRVGQPFDYDIVVTNLTSGQVDDVVVTDQVNSNFKLERSTPEADTNSDGVMTFALGELKGGESRTIRVNGSAVGEGAISSCATCTYSSMLCSSIPVVAPKLRLVKTGPAEVLKCDEIAYTFEVSNSGTGTINNVRISDTLPNGLMTIDNKKAIDINVGTLAAGQTKKFTSNVRADKAGEFDNKATAAGDGVTADSSLITTVVRQPVLSVDLECPETTMIGRELTYKATVKSTGDAPSANTMLTLTLPTGATFIRADNNGASSGGKTTWNLGTLKPEESRTVNVTVRSMSAGTLAANAAVQGACAAIANDSCSVTIQGVPDIGTGIEDDSGVRLVGDNHVFRYVVKNQGQVDLSNVTLTAELSAGLDFVSSTSPTQPRASGKSVVWNLGTIKPGQQIEFVITAKGTAAGEQTLKTTTKSDQLKLTVENNEQVTFINR